MAKQKNGETAESEVTETVTAEPKFTKEQLLNSKKYSNNKDILAALLKEDESYSHSEVTKLIQDFMKGAVK